MDTLNVRSYWNWMDYLGRKADEKARKESQRTHAPPQTPISQYVTPETGFIIGQFKSPRSAP